MTGGGRECACERVCVFRISARLDAANTRRSASSSMGEIQLASKMADAFDVISLFFYRGLSERRGGGWRVCVCVCVCVCACVCVSVCVCVCAGGDID